MGKLRIKGINLLVLGLGEIEIDGDEVRELARLGIIL